MRKFESHVELLIGQKIKEGMFPEEARRAAKIVRRRRTSEGEVPCGTRRMHGSTLCCRNPFWRRMLRKNPGFTLSQS